jgi:SAM-dependent methyltransferase
MNTREMEALAAGKAALDVGCGRAKVAGSVGIDIAVASDADVRHDLGVFPYPVEDNRFDVIFCRNVIEHVPDVVRLMEEIHRMGKPGADVFITTPHFSSVYSYQDPTHVRHLSMESLDYFTRDTKHSNFYSSCRFEITERALDFGKSIPFSWIARALFALSPKRYEKHFAFMFPANSIFFRLRVVK